ncbi:MAG: rRNA pseudouridine synthase [Chitinophagaceae bacterium]|nr:MAG: rRNA pseudouridine synthase [Chitinophagaceae bacterium]
MKKRESQKNQKIDSIHLKDSSEFEEMRLNKYLSNAGIASRRKADEIIQSGKVKVNGVVVKEMGHKVKPNDKVIYQGKLVKPERYVYILLNKPKNCITTVEDEKERRTVLDYIAGATQYRVFPVGRLDRNTTGVLLITNDGELTFKLTHPSHEIEKVYMATLDKPLNIQDFEKILAGLTLEDGPVFVNELAFPDEKDKKVVGISLHEGRNHIVKRIFKHLNYEVVKLDRALFAGLTKKNLSRGKWRYLEDKEVIRLKHLSNKRSKKTT